MDVLNVVEGIVDEIVDVVVLVVVVLVNALDSVVVVEMNTVLVAGVVDVEME